VFQLCVSAAIQLNGGQRSFDARLPQWQVGGATPLV
jgi:hypothetical protein